MDVIMVAVAKTQESRAALQEAVWLAELTEGRIVLVSHVTDPRDAASARGYREVQDAERRYLTDLGKKEIPEAVPWDAHVSTLSGKTGGALAQVARDEDARVLMIGVRRRSPVGKLVLGSTARDVLLEADCPVVAVKGGPGR